MVEKMSLSAARGAMKQIVEADVAHAAGKNDVVSRTEAKRLDPFVRRSEVELRKKGGRIRTAPLASHALGEVDRAWQKFNASGKKSLSSSELAKMKKADPALAKLTESAILRASKGTAKKATTTKKAPAPKHTSTKSAGQAKRPAKIR